MGLIEKRASIPFGRPMIGDEEKAAVMDVLSGHILVHGPRATTFENDFANYVGGGNAISVSSCTAGLHLFYFAMGLSEGDEVIVPAQTHTATAHAVALTGAKPVFVDAEIHTGNIDIDQIEDAITDRTRAICVVHYLGMPVDMDRVNAMAEKHGLKVLEDAALAIGSRFNGVHAGLLGDAGTFSFYPVKHMTTAEGGMVTTRDPVLAEAIRATRAFGVDRTHAQRHVPGQYDVPRLGFNYRMNEISAALGSVQIGRMEGFLKARRANYEVLEAGLSEIAEIDLFKSTHGAFESSYYCLSVILNEELMNERPSIMEFLKNFGIGTSIYYPGPVPDLTYYKHTLGEKGPEFPVARAISQRSIALPVGPHLTPDDMEMIVQGVKEALIHVKRR
ncbi:MAG: DegT/DnrJ/EryC1/StrS family aminotransferase [Pseudomonadota bacterium]